jgi:SiaC family regulatory phosphoprotein
MRPLDIQAGKTTPRILYNPQENVLQIIGSSLPENVYTLYEPIIEWIEEFITSPVLEPAMRIIFKIQYYNSGTIRYFAEMLTKIASLHDRGLNYSVEWHYEAGDDNIRDAGVDLSDISETPFTMISYRKD